MAWIESHDQLEDHPKLHDLMRLMGWSKDKAIGKLHRFWWWCTKYAPDGDLRGHADERIANAVGVKSELSHKFVRTMLEVRWIEHEPYLRVHDWWDYYGTFLQIKYKHYPEKWQAIRDLYDPAKNSSKNGAKNPLPNQPNQPNQPNLVPTADAAGLAEHLRARILANDPKAKVPTDLAKWAEDADRLLRLDGRKADEVRIVIDWCQADAFWRSNILSMGKLREKFTALSMKMKGEKNGKAENSSAVRPEPGKYKGIGKVFETGPGKAD